MAKAKTPPANTKKKKVKTSSGRKSSKTPSKKNRNSSKYTEEQIAEAIEMIKSGALSKKRASQVYGIPRQTLQYRMGSRFVKPRRGPSTVLTDEEEELLVKWLAECQRKGFPKRQLHLQKSVEEFFKLETDRPTPFTNGKPGKSWLKGFLDRHPDISWRKPEAVTAASANVSSLDIKKWFHNIEEHLKEEGVFEVLGHPERVFNGDETNFLLCPNTGRVLARKGSKNVYEVDCGTAKSAVTVMFTFSAAGDSVPPMLIYPYVRLPREIIKSVPENWGVGRSDSGWMKSENFFEYIGNIFVPFLIQKSITRPVILFVDGHKSHLTYQVSELCREEKIILIALYPNATRILQPADVAAFRPIKQGWINEIAEWRSENPGEAVTKELVAPLLDRVLRKSLRPDILKNGFRACGLYPWDFSAIDTSKCLGHSNSQGHNQVEEQPKTSKVLDFRTFRNMAGPKVMKTLIQEDTLAGSNGLEKTGSEYEMLVRKIFYFFGSPSLDGSVKEVINCPTRRTLFEEPTNNYEMNEFSFEEHTDPHMNIDDMDFIVADINGPGVGEQEPPMIDDGEQQGSNQRHELSVIHEPDTNNNEAENISVGDMEVLDISNPTTLRDVLHWPTTPKRKGKKTVTRMPYVISSRQWQEMFDEKDNKKKQEETAKEERRQIREQNKLLKENKKNKKQDTNEENAGTSLPEPINPASDSPKTQLQDPATGTSQPAKLLRNELLNKKKRNCKTETAKAERQATRKQDEKQEKKKNKKQKTIQDHTPETSKPQAPAPETSSLPLLQDQAPGTKQMAKPQQPAPETSPELPMIDDGEQQGSSHTSKPQAPAPETSSLPLLQDQAPVIKQMPKPQQPAPETSSMTQLQNPAPGTSHLTKLPRGSLCYKCGTTAKISDSHQCESCTRVFHKKCEHDGVDLDDGSYFFVCLQCLQQY